MGVTADASRSRVDVACPLCGGPSKLWRRKTTEYGLFNLDRCQRCAFTYVNPRPSHDALVNIYRTRGEDRKSTVAEVRARESAYPNSSIDARRFLEIIQRFRQPPARLLDIGCGCGFATFEAVKAGFDVEALEVGDLERRCTVEIAGVEPRNVSFEDYECGDGSFDAILMSQILEHVVDVNLWISRARRALSRDGLIMIAVPNFNSVWRRLLGSSDPYITPPIHLNHFSRKNLTGLLRAHGFEVVHVDEVSRLPLDVISKRFPRLLRRPIEAVTRIGGKAFERILNGTRMGVMLNVYAVRR